MGKIVAVKSVQDVLDQLAAEGFPVAVDGAQGAWALPDERHGQATPWYVRLFVAASAWLAAALIVVGLFMLDLFQDPGDTLLPGLLLCAAAAALHRFRPRSDFLSQLALAASLVGQVLAAVGFNWASNSLSVAALLLILLECVLILVYNHPVHRFLSALAITGGLFVVLIDQQAEAGLHAIILGLAAAASILFSYETRSRLSRVGDWATPVGYGASVALLATLILPLTDLLDVPHWWITAAGLWLVLVLVVWHIVAGLRRRPTAARTAHPAAAWLGLLAAGLAVLVLAGRVPGILGALLVLVLGFWRHQRLLIGLAGAFLVFYLGAYYYSLEWTLLAKSVALTGMGALLLLVRYALNRAMARRAG